MDVRELNEYQTEKEIFKLLCVNKKIRTIIQMMITTNFRQYLIFFLNMHVRWVHILLISFPQNKNYLMIQFSFRNQYKEKHQEK